MKEQLLQKKKRRTSQRLQLQSSRGVKQRQQGWWQSGLQSAWASRMLLLLRPLALQLFSLFSLHSLLPRRRHR